MAWEPGAQLELLGAVNASVASQWYGMILQWNGMVFYGTVLHGYGMLLHGMVWYSVGNASVASQRPSIKTATALPLQLLPHKKPRILKKIPMKKTASLATLFSSLATPLEVRQYWLSKMSPLFFNAENWRRSILINNQMDLASIVFTHPSLLHHIILISHFLTQPPLLDGPGSNHQLWETEEEAAREASGRNRKRLLETNGEGRGLKKIRIRGRCKIKRQKRTRGRACLRQMEKEED